MRAWLMGGMNDNILYFYAFRIEGAWDLYNH